MPTDPPNVLVVMADDHGQWALGSYGNAEVRTPALDYLAKTGVRFANSFTPTPVCSPARASFWTGRLPSQHGIHDFLGSGSEGNDWMRDEVTIAELLHERGYVTGLAGKWHLGQDDRIQPGFDYWYSQSLKTRLPDGFESPWSGPVPAPTLQPIGPPEAHVLATEPGYDSHATTDYAVHFLRTRDRTRPFFLFVGHIATHSIWSEHPEHLVDQYRSCFFADVPSDVMYPFGRPVVEAMLETRNDPQEALAQYYAAVTEIDAGVGRLLDELQTQGISDNTIVVYTSDHGCMCSHHGLWGKGNATRPLNMLEESIRVPLIVSHPGHLFGHQVRVEFVDHCDLFQTLLDSAGAGIDGQTQVEKRYPGRSFGDALQGKELRDWRRGQYGEYGNLRMLRTDQFKLVRRYPDGPNELIDLLADPRETTNLFGQEPYSRVVAELTMQLDEWFAGHEDPKKSGLLVRELPRHNTEEAWRDLQ